MLDITVKIEVRSQDRYGSDPWAYAKVETVADESQIERFVNDSVDTVVSDVFRQHELRIAARDAVADKE